MATAGGNNLGPPPIISLGSPLHPPQQPLSPIIQPTSPPATSNSAIATIPIGGGVTVSGTSGLRESQAPNPGDLSGIFSVVLNRQHQQNAHPLSHHHVRWPSFSMGNRSFWTKYCLLCTVCGSAATILAGIFLIVAALFRYYTTSIYYFETVPTYIPAILVRKLTKLFLSTLITSFAKMTHVFPHIFCSSPYVVLVQLHFHAKEIATLFW